MATDYDVIIIGGGPTGLAAAVYTGRALLRTLVLEKQTVGGQVALSAAIDNYPGFAGGISGYDFAEAFLKHAKRFGAEVRIGVGAESSCNENGSFTVGLGDETSVTTKTVILAMGRHPRRLEVPGYDKLFGKGVSVCATCDGLFPQRPGGRGRRRQLGGRRRPLPDALRFRDQFGSPPRPFTAQKILIEQYLHDPKVNPVWNSVVEEIYGENEVDGSASAI